MILKKLKMNTGLAVGALVFAAGLWLAAGSGSDAGVPLQQEDKRPVGELVEAYEVQTAVHSWKVSASGRLRALDSLQIVAEVSGKVTWIDDRMRSGGRFERGETLFRIDPTTFRNDLARAKASRQAAEASLVKARADNSRAVELHGQGNVSKATVDATTAALLNAEAALAQADAALSTAQEMLDRTVVKAPFDALVIDESLSLDSFVSPGQPVANLMGTRRAEMAISLQQNEIQAIAETWHQGAEQPIPVTARPGNGAVGSLAIEGQIARIAPVIDQSSKTATIIAEFDNVFSVANAGQVFGDDFMSVEIEARAANPLWEVPYGAIRKGSFVWVIGEDGRIRHEAVTVMSTDGHTGVVASVSPLMGKRVMLTLLAEEIEGKPVRIAAKR